MLEPDRLAAIKAAAKKKSTKTSNVILELVGYIERLQALTIKLLSEKEILERDLRQTQYLSVIWVKILDSYVPKESRKRVMQELASGIAEGMKQAGIKEYNANLDQLENPPDSEGKG